MMRHQENALDSLRSTAFRLSNFCTANPMMEQMIGVGPLFMVAVNDAIDEVRRERERRDEAEKTKRLALIAAGKLPTYASRVKLKARRRTNAALKGGAK